MKNRRGRVELLLTVIDQAYEKKAWHGTNLKGSIRGLTAEEALWTPSNQRHSIRDLVLHAAYWKYTVRRRLLREKRGSFPLKGSNFFPLDGEFGEKEWRDCVKLLDEQHRLLRTAVSDLADEDLTVKSGKYVISDLVHGIAGHDLYHAGQIQLLKRLREVT
ncbi:MAG TPA: DinB family protein [Thermoanaerobaculia bacterium]|nr:DinB family protein [Thermoanaerobaculia bacterium]